MAHLQVGTETFELEGGPDDMGQDSVRLRGLMEEFATVRSQSAINDLPFRPQPQPKTHPRSKVLGIRGEIRLLLPHRRLVIKDQDRPLGSLEPGDPPRAALLVSFFPDDGLEDVTHDVPVLVVFGAKEDDGSADLVVATRMRERDDMMGGSAIDGTNHSDLIVGTDDGSRLVDGIDTHNEVGVCKMASLTICSTLESGTEPPLESW
jgi:hypothetical protein